MCDYGASLHEWAQLHNTKFCLLCQSKKWVSGQMLISSTVSSSDISHMIMINCYVQYIYDPQCVWLRWVYRIYKLSLVMLRRSFSSFCPSPRYSNMKLKYWLTREWFPWISCGQLINRKKEISVNNTDHSSIYMYVQVQSSIDIF